MTVLTKDVIIKEIKKGRIKIEPFNESNIGPASIDLALGNDFRRFKKKKNQKITEDACSETMTDVMKISDEQTIKIKPGELILGITREKITLPNNICGWLNSRSRFARFGLMSHITAPFVCPGVSNKQVLELYNASKTTLELEPGLKICQIILETCEGKAKYRGKYKNQKTP